MGIMIPLNDKFQRKQFESAMNVLRDNVDSLSDYDRQLFHNLESGYQMVGQAMNLTVKQLNYIKQLAFDLEKLS